MLPIRLTLDGFLRLLVEIDQALSEAQDFAALEKNIAAAVRTCACGLLAGALESLDEQLAANRDKTRWKPVNRKARTVVTIVGEVTYWRRYDVDPQTGERRFLLDERLGIAERQRMSPGLREQAVTLAMEMSYRRAAKVLSQWVPAITAMAVWQELQRAGEAERQQAAASRERVFERGQVRELCVEADGVMIRAREAEGERKHMEVKLAVAYEGKRPTAQGRQALVERRLVGGVIEGPVFWEEAVVEWGRTWDWRSVERCWLGTDGAAWAKKGVELLPGAVHRLDGFHLRRALLRALGREQEAYRAVCAALEAQEWGQVEAALKEAERGSGARGQERIRELRKYLRQNWGGIVGSGAAAGLGAIEGQVFHTVARRMKRHGARWSAKGADHLVRVMVARANGKPPVWRSKQAGGSAEGRKEARWCPSEGERLMRKQRAAGEW